MIKIVIDFDETTQTVKNVVVSPGMSVTGSTSKPATKKTTKKNKSAYGDKPIVEVGENKLILSDQALTLIDAEPGESRITINYFTVSNTDTFPLIGKSEAFVDKAAGNKLTKSNTVSFKGQQRTILLEYGTLFTLEKHITEGQFKLVPIESVDEVVSADTKVLEELSIEEQELKDIENIDIDLEIGDFNSVIEEDEDELPF